MSRIPKALRAWCDAHPQQVADLTCGEGYANGRAYGFSYEVALRDGWCFAPAEHIAIEGTVRDMLGKLREIVPCACAQCRRARS